MLTARRPSFHIVPAPRRYKVPTKKEIKDMRIASMEFIANELGLRWGGIEKGNVVTVFFGDGAYLMRGLPEAERWLMTWKNWCDNGATWWYDWNYAVLNYPSEQWLEAYEQLREARRLTAKLTA